MPVGAASVTTVGVAVEAVPVFVTAMVKVASVPAPAVTLVGLADFTTVTSAAPVTVVGVVTVNGQPPVVVHPAPVQVAVLVMTVPAAAVAASRTSKDRSTDAPAASPAAIVHVTVLPVTLIVHDGVLVADRLPHVSEPATSVVPAGAESVTTVAPVVAPVPLFVPSRV